MLLRPQEVVRKLMSLGFESFPSRGKGSHVVFIHPDGRRTMVAMHSKDMPIGTYRRILKDIGLSDEEFRQV